MSKTRKNQQFAPNVVAKTTNFSNNTISYGELPAFFSNTLLQSFVIFILAFLLYANTLGHQWAQDDAIVITDNEFTQKGFAGIADIFSKDTFYGFFKEEGKAALVSGGRYRPLTLAIFAMIYQFSGKNPATFHLLTVLLFALTCVLLFRTLKLLLETNQPVIQTTNYPNNQSTNQPISFFTTLLFLAHPIHTEVVANVKGCDEIVTLMGSLGALYLTLKAFDTGKVFWSIAAGLVFFLGLLAKENSTTFLAVIPLGLWFFRNANRSQIIRGIAPLLTAFVVFFLIRSSVLPRLFAPEPLELMNNPYLKIVGNQWVKFSSGERLATIIYSLGKYIQLLILPHPLTHDYYPRHIDIMSFAKPGVWVSILIYGGLLWYAISGILNGKKNTIHFGILFFILTLSIVSNLIFPIGTNMGERFMFMPSIGFCLVVTSLILSYFLKPQKENTKANLSVIIGVAGILTLLYATKTLFRNPVWKDDKTLFFNDVKTSSNSAKLQNACGGVCCTEAGLEQDSLQKIKLYQQSIQYLTKALQIHPTYKDALLNRGIGYYNLKNYEAAQNDFKMADFVAPNDPKGKKNLAIAYRDAAKYYGEKKGDLAKALDLLQKSIQIDNTDNETIRLLGVANGVSGNHAEAIKWFTKRTELEPKNAAAWQDLSMAYGASGNLVKSQELRLKAEELKK
jgi:protein O-mannosyl-transferase